MQFVREALERLGVVLYGHFVLKSGRHSEQYVNKDILFAHPLETMNVCYAIANSTKLKPDTVVGPVHGGLMMAQYVAGRFTQLHGKPVMSIYAEKDLGTFVIKRGYDKLVTGKRVLVVEDVLTTGGSVSLVVKAVRELGGEVIGVEAIVNRGNVTANDVGDVPLRALVNIDLSTWEGPLCPLCASGVPVNINVGHGKEFVAAGSH